jgi:hypothetical protein
MPKEMKNKTNLLLIVVMLFVSCNHVCEQKSFIHFPAEYTLQPRIIELEEVYVFASVLIYDSLYILTNTPGNSCQIHLYNHDFAYLGSGGRVGNGPGEIVNPFLPRIDQKAGILWFADMGRKELLKFPLDTLIRNLQFLPIEKVPLPKDLWIMTLYDPLPNGLFRFADYQSPDIFIAFFNCIGKRVDSLTIYQNPLLNNLQSMNEQAFMPTYMYAFHPDNQRIALGYVYSDILAILNPKGEIISHIQGPDGINQLPNIINQDQIKCYAHIQVDDRYIYLLFNGKPSFDFQQKVNFPDRIFVFDWDGVPVASLLLEHPIPQFTLDKVNNRFIAMSPTTGEVVIYDIPEDIINRGN